MSRPHSVFAALALAVVLSAPISRLAADSSMNGGDSFFAGQSWSSGNGHYLYVTDSNHWQYGAYVFWSGSSWWSYVDVSGFPIHDQQNNLHWCCGYGYHYPQNTGGNDNTVLIMQYDGNLVLYNDNDANQPLWSTHTYGNPGAFLRLQDGNGDGGQIVVYDSSNAPLWSIY